MSQSIKNHDLSYTQNRELSWLKFNSRVMEEAADPTVPLMERFRFLSIFTSNLDEFFMVRVGSLFDLSIVTPKDRENKSGLTPAQQLVKIFDAVRPMICQRDRIYTGLCHELETAGVRDIPYSQLKDGDKAYIQGYYKENIRPLLSPQIIDRSHPFPHLKNKALYAAALLKDRENNRTLLGIAGVPDSVPPILFLPGRSTEFVRTEDILQSHLRKIFKIYKVEEFAIISVTRNADFSYDEKFDDDTADYRDHMAKLLKIRDKLAPVRLEMQGEAPALKILLREMLKLEENQCYTCTCPLNLSYAYMLDGCDKSLYNVPHRPAWPQNVSRNIPMWEQIQNRDLLLFYPYHTMEPFLNLLHDAASDPQVQSIRITIYRLARNSAVAKSLCAAAENGKDVTVLMELRARFDEKNNIDWAEELEEAGCKIIYGLDGYKCHSKICLITRRDERGLSYVTQIGTGNYNEKTSALYTDFSLMTASPSIAEDAISFFENMMIGNLRASYDKLLVAPVGLKPEILKAMDREISRGRDGRIIIKANSITERELIDKLKEASCAGVKIDLIIRGICCIVPGIPGKTENITVTSIVGRFLEHSRIYSFGTGTLQLLYISSADIMTRNQTRRVEVACPVEDFQIRNWFSRYLEVLLADNLKARRLQPDGNYIRVRSENSSPLSVQQYYLEHPQELPGAGENPMTMPAASVRSIGQRNFVTGLLIRFLRKKQ